MIITIDGPAGTGKSTIAKLVAQKLGFVFFDTGAMYRTITYLVLKNKLDMNDKQQMQNCLDHFVFSIERHNNRIKYFANGEDVSEVIRSIEVNQHVSNIATLAAVRDALVFIQRQFGQNAHAVFEGRDLGTVVFPNANVKIFLTASPPIRAARRFKEYMEKNPDKTIDQQSVLADIMNRDQIDSSRTLSPLKQAEDAFLIDTSDLSIEEVVEQVLYIVEKAKKQ